MLRRITWVLAVVCPLRVGDAQTPDSLRPAACIPRSSDSVIAAAFIRVTAFDTTQGIAGAYLSLWAGQINQQFHISPPVVLSVLFKEDPGKTPPDTQATGYFGFFGMYGLTLHRGKPAENIQTLQTTLNPAVDSALLRAIHDGAAAPGAPPFPERARGDAATLRVRLWSFRTKGPPTERGGALFRYRSPLFRIVQEARPLPGLAPPRYPEEDRRAGKEGMVDMIFVIGVDGVPVEGTILVERATNLPFVARTVEAIRSYRYSPARVAGCPVAILAFQPFDFRLVPP